MPSVLELYKQKKAAEAAKGAAAPQINAPESEAKLANETQREVEGERQTGPDPSTSGAAASTASSPDATTTPPAELTRGQKAAATRAAKKASGADPGFVLLADASDRDLVAELFTRGFGVTKL
jgi:hypothetical protein